MRMSKFNNDYPCNKENIRRNIDLWNDRQHGFTYPQLSDKYRITKERCRQIYLRVERIRTRSIYANPLYKEYFGEDRKDGREADNE